MSVWKNEKFWCVVAGVVGPTIIKKILKAPKTREYAVKGLAEGMKITADAKAAFPGYEGRSCRHLQRREESGWREIRNVILTLEPKAIGEGSRTRFYWILRLRATHFAQNDKKIINYSQPL